MKDSQLKDSASHFICICQVRQQEGNQIKTHRFIANVSTIRITPAPLLLPIPSAPCILLCSFGLNYFVKPHFAKPVLSVCISVSRIFFKQHGDSIAAKVTALSSNNFFFNVILETCSNNPRNMCYLL